MGYSLTIESLFEAENIHFFRFGCCTDGETPSGGPNGENCDENKLCKNSKFGCCPDDRTFSQGPHKQGCFECPEEVRAKTYSMVFFVKLFYFLDLDVRLM